MLLSNVILIFPVAEKFNDYAFQLKSQLNQLDIRAKVDDGSDSFSKKIRNAELMKIPYTIIVGEKEQNSDSVSVREFRSKAQYEKSVVDFIAQVTTERDQRKLSSEVE